MSSAPGNVKYYDGSGDWFKVAELGAKPDCPQENFAADKSQFPFGPCLGMNSNPGVAWPATGLTSFNFTIPQKTPSGQYLLRIEHVGLHRAQYEHEAEFFISCAHINVIEGSSGHPTPTAKFAGAYNSRDPGILVNVYDISCYTPPGPAVWTGN